MQPHELSEEIENGVQFYGINEENVLVTMIGIQPNLTLHQSCMRTFLQAASEKVSEKKLLHHLLSIVNSPPVDVGTWEPAIGQPNSTKKMDSNEFY